MILGLTKNIVVLDVETGSPTQLGPKGRGAANYWRDPSTKVYMLGHKKLRHPDPAGVYDFEALQNDDHRTPLQIMSPALIRAIQAPKEEWMLAAYNIEFDREALARIGLPTPSDKWIDIMTLSYIKGFNGRLSDVLKQVGLDAAKHPRGSQAISYFSSQMHPWYSRPDLWQDFRDYCADDARIEELLLSWLLERLDTDMMRPSVQSIMRQELIYREVNRRGIPVDVPAVRGAQAIMSSEKEVTLERMRVLTGMENPNSRDQIRAWFESKGCPLPDTRAETITNEVQYQGVHLADAEADPLEDPAVVERHRLLLEVLMLHQSLSKTSTTKYDAIARNLCEWDNRVRNLWQFYGASRTGRVAGRIINPANLARPRMDNPEVAVLAIATGNRELLEVLYPQHSVLEVLSWCIRASLKAPEGKRWCVSDLTSIESVGLAWLAGCKKILDIFFAGRDTYKTFAASALGKPYEEITKAERTFHKPGVLGSGYGASGHALVSYAAGMGVTLTEEDAAKQVATFREEYHEIPHFWRNLENAIRTATRHPGRVCSVYPVDSFTEWEDPCDHKVHREYTYKDWPRVDYWYNGEFLYCLLPCGRYLCYYKPFLADKEITLPSGYSFTVKDAIHYYGTDQKATGAKWQIISSHAGLFAENCTQALCRDVMWWGLEQAEMDPGLEVLGDVYDEVITLADEHDTGALDRLNSYLTSKAPWLDEHFFLGANGYISERYKKD